MISLSSMVELCVDCLVAVVMIWFHDSDIVFVLFVPGGGGAAVSVTAAPAAGAAAAEAAPEEEKKVCLA